MATTLEDIMLGRNQPVATPQIPPSTRPEDDPFIQRMIIDSRQTQYTSR